MPNPVQWPAAVRGDSNFDLLSFITPIMFGVILVATLIAGKYAQHPDHAWVCGGWGTLAVWITCRILAYWYNIPLDQCAGGLLGAALAMGQGI